jgi:nucleoside-diphosphate-sugar epimerase
VNIGVGEDVTIRELAETVKQVVGYEGELVFDATKPDGTPRKLMDVGSSMLEDGRRRPRSVKGCPMPIKNSWIRSPALYSVGLALG